MKKDRFIIGGLAFLKVLRFTFHWNPDKIQSFIFEFIAITDLTKNKIHGYANWYLITGRKGEIMMVKSTSQKAEDLAEEYTEALDYVFTETNYGPISENYPCRLSIVRCKD